MTGLLRPGVASEVCRNLLALVHIVNLSVLSNQIVVDILPDVLEGVAGTSQQHGVTFEVIGVERQLEDSWFDGLRDVQADGALA